MFSLRSWCLWHHISSSFSLEKSAQSLLRSLRMKPILHAECRQLSFRTLNDILDFNLFHLLWYCVLWTRFTHHDESCNETKDAIIWWVESFKIWQIHFTAYHYEGLEVSEPPQLSRCIQEQRTSQVTSCTGQWPGTWRKMKMSEDWRS